MSEPNSNAKVVPREFFQTLAVRAEVEKARPMPVNMDFPLLDEMEMDVPVFGMYMEESRFPEDDSDLDMQYLMHVNPTLAMSGIGI